MLNATPDRIIPLEWRHKGYYLDFDPGVYLFHGDRLVKEFVAPVEQVELVKVVVEDWNSTAIDNQATTL